MRALVLFEDQLLRNLISFYLEGRFQMTCRLAVSVDEAVSLLSDNNDAFDILVCDYNPVSKTLISFALKKNIDLHFLFSADKTPEDPMLSRRKEWVHFFSKTNLILGLESTVRDLFKEFQVENIADNSLFCPLSPQLLLAGSPLKGHVYIRLSNIKYVRILREGFDFDQSDFEYFTVKKKISILYIKKQSCNDFALMIQNNYLQNKYHPAASLVVTPADLIEAKRKRLQYLKARAQALEADKSVSESENPEELQKKAALLAAQKKALEEKRQINIQAKAKEILVNKLKTTSLAAALAKNRQAEAEQRAKVEEIRRSVESKKLEKDLGSELAAVHQLGRTLGFTKEVQEVTKKNVMQTIEKVRTAPKLTALLAQISNEKDKYISSHSMLLAYLGCALASQMEWSSDTTYQKITLAAFLHDVSLKNQDLAQIQSLGELAQKSKFFTKEEQKEFRNHPIAACDISKTFDEVPPDVDSIIIQHHERPDGSGFPRGITHSRIGPLSAVFIVAHDLVRYLLENSSTDLTTNNKALDSFVKLHQKSYQQGNFKKIIAAVTKLKT